MGRDFIPARVPISITHIDIVNRKNHLFISLYVADVVQRVGFLAFVTLAGLRLFGPPCATLCAQRVSQVVVGCDNLHQGRGWLRGNERQTITIRE